MYDYFGFIWLFALCVVFFIGLVVLEVWIACFVVVGCECFDFDLIVVLLVIVWCLCVLAILDWFSSLCVGLGLLLIELFGGWLCLGWVWLL